MDAQPQATTRELVLCVAGLVLFVWITCYGLLLLRDDDRASPSAWAVLLMVVFLALFVLVCIVVLWCVGMTLYVLGYMTWRVIMDSASTTTTTVVIDPYGP